MNLPNPASPVILPPSITTFPLTIVRMGHPLSSQPSKLEYPAREYNFLAFTFAFLFKLTITKSASEPTAIIPFRGVRPYFWAGLKQQTWTNLSKVILPLFTPSLSMIGNHVSTPAIPTGALQKSFPFSSFLTGAWSVPTKSIIPFLIACHRASLSSLCLIGGFTFERNLSVLSVFRTRYWGQVSATIS